MGFATRQTPAMFAVRMTMSCGPIGELRKTAEKKDAMDGAVANIVTAIGAERFCKVVNEAAYKNPPKMQRRNRISLRRRDSVDSVEILNILMEMEEMEMKMKPTTTIGMNMGKVVDAENAKCIDVCANACTMPASRPSSWPMPWRLRSAYSGGWERFVVAGVVS